MALIIGTKQIWNVWAPIYEKIWGFQHFSLTPTRNFVRKYLKESGSQSENILDIGCGIGELSFELSQQYPEARILAIDYSDGMIERAKKDYAAPNITHILGSLEDIPPNTKFDLIVSTHSFPYFPDKMKAAKQMFNFLIPSGRILLIQGNTNNLYDAAWLALVKLGVSKADFLSVYEIRDILQEAGFTIGTVQRINTAFFIPSIYLVEGFNTS
jgi:ubiquinone/menaquinone biosynthesis C-methylase UbiE